MNAFPSVRIEGINSQGAGVGRLPDGRTVFVPRTAPGDLVTVRVGTLKARWARGEVQEILEQGPGRRVAPCPYYLRCGGCTLQHLDPETQRAARKAVVEETLRRIGGIQTLPAAEWHPVAGESEFRYRNRLTFHLRRLPGGRVVAGFHDRNSPGRIVEVDSACLLPEAGVAEAWDALRAGWGPGARRLPGGKELRLTLRGVAGGGVILLIEGGKGPGDPQALLEAAGLLAVWLRPEGEERARLGAGDRGVEEDWFGERLSIRPGAFSQVNRVVGEALHGWVLEQLGAEPGERVLDAYSGSGSYGRHLAARGVAVIGIEVDPDALSMAATLPVDGFTLLAGTVEDRVGEGLPADRVILNPPRSGVEDGVMEALAAAAPVRIVYVSCDPATLARDLDRLGAGYRVEQVRLFDLFPQTAHVETVVTLNRSED